MKCAIAGHVLGRLLLGVVFCGLAAAGVEAVENTPTNSRAALIRYLDTQAYQFLEIRRHAIAAIATPAEAEARKTAVRAKLLALIGVPVHGVPLASHVTGKSHGDGYRVENLLFDAQPGRHVTANLFLPDAGTRPFPALILSPGHVPSGKLSDYSFAANFARNGFVVLAYDIVGEGERLEYFDAQSGRSLGERPTGDHSLAAYPALLNGEHVARYFVEDAMQGIDYLVSRAEVDAQRIGAFGCSGGGTVTAYLAALDERVQAAASACYVNDFAHLLPTAGVQDAEQSIPDFIADGFDIPDWVELAAPKPYAIVSTTGDMFPFAGAQAAVEEIRHFWSVYGAADRVEWFYGPGPHGAIAPMGDQIIAFFRRALKSDSASVPFVALQPAHDEDVRVTASGQLATSLGGVTLADLARARAMAIAPIDKKPDPLRLRAAITTLARVEALPGATVGARRLTETVHDGMTLDTFEMQSAMGPLAVRVLAATGQKNSRVMLTLRPTPLDSAALPNGGMAQLAAAGWTAIDLQVRAVDGNGGAKNKIVGDQDLLALHAMLVGRTLPGIRIDDTLRAIDWIRQRWPQASITLEGVGFMGPVALQAALLDTRVDAVRIEGSPVSWRAAAEQPLARDLPANAIPGVLAAYDLPDVIAALAPRRVDVIAPVDPMGAPLREAAFWKLVAKLPHVHYLADKAALP
jgi:dienelactone hydrolase